MIAMPKFTAEISLSGSRQEQRNTIPSETTKLSPTRYMWNISEAQTESTDNGRRAWKDLESSCYNLQCQKCLKDCFAFINGLHDAVNIKLGKPVRTPNNFAYLG